MPERKFNVILSMFGCFTAIETGALVVCVGIMFFDSALTAILAGGAFWALNQPIILLIAIFLAPFGAFLRMILGLMFGHPRRVALIAGTTLGTVGALFAVWLTDPPDDWVVIVAIGAFAGLTGGWSWWRVEKPFLTDGNPPEFNYDVRKD